MKEENKTSQEILPESERIEFLKDIQDNYINQWVCNGIYRFNKALAAAESDNERKDKEIKEKAREILRLKWKNRALNNLWSTTCNKQERENEELKKQLSAKDQEIAELKLKLNRV